ncbi:MAG: spore coat protein CotH [Clostridiales bacterium]|nr:spore coat protein CotH [Clostridiales bacterium]
MRIKRGKGVAGIVVCVAVLLGMNVWYQKCHVKIEQNIYGEHLELVEETGEPLAHLDDEFVADEGFETGLPIIVLDMNGKEPPITLAYNQETKIYETLEDVEPYIEGRIQVIDSGGLNHITDKPVQESKILIKRRGNTSMMYDKPQYLVKLRTESGQDNKISLLSMGADDEWVLNGSMSDPSMMRNYLCYRVASQMTDYAPDTKYCEVFIRKDGKYTYQGVYLLGEKVGQGEYRVNISDYKKSDVYTPYIVRRDRYDKEGLMLDTYATREGLTYGYLGVIYPSRYKISEETVQYIEQDISKVEQILYADDYMTFSRYPDYIDVDSFVDYFIINEFFGNYDAGNNSTYMYKELGGKLKIGPVWDYDGAIDNYKLAEMSEEDLAFYTAPFFDRLVQDQAFMEKVQKRYARLRRGLLSEENIIGLVDEIHEYLTYAQPREWARWSKMYQEKNSFALVDYLDEDGDLIVRQSDSYEQELYRIKTVLRKHGDSIMRDLKDMREGTELDTGRRGRNGIFFIICLAVFFVPAIYVSREK